MKRSLFPHPTRGQTSRIPSPRTATGAAVVCLVVLLWLVWLSGNAQQRRGEFWQTDTYNASSHLEMLLKQDQAANAAVELVRKGWHVPLTVALTQTMAVPTNGSNARAQAEASLELSILIAVTSTCCTQQAKQRRRAIRQSWANTIIEKSLPVHLKFVLAQPTPDKLEDAHKLLLEEVIHGDLLFVQNKELYNNLPLKTISIMRYVTSAFPRYSHVLKTDDDCYVRVPKLIEMVKQVERRNEDSMLYVGRQENPHGFFPIRDPGSKWYIPFEEMPDDVVPWKTRYLAGWGYLLSRSAAQLVVSKVDQYEQQPETAPGWYAGMHWEDVLVGLLLHEYAEPQNKPDFFRAAWDSCSAGTVVKHMDVEALQVFPMLYEQESTYAGPWAVQTVNCQVGGYSAGDYWSWKHWRDTLPDVLPV